MILVPTNFITPEQWDRYAYAPLDAGSYISTPDSSSFDWSNGVDISIRMSMENWSPTTTGNIVTQYAGTQRAFIFGVLTSGNLYFVTSASGSANLYNNTLAASPGFTNGSIYWLRFTFETNNGSGNARGRFYYAPDQEFEPTSWTLQGTTEHLATHTLHNSTAKITLGCNGDGSAQIMGKFYKVIVRPFGGSIVAAPDFTSQSLGITSFTDPQGNVWTPEDQSRIQRKNYIYYSEDFSNSRWNKAQLTVSTDATTAPNGTTSADKITDNAVSSQHYTMQSHLKAPITQDWTFSFYARAAEHTTCSAYLWDNTSGLTHVTGVNLSTGAVGSSGTSGTGITNGAYSVTDAGNGWWRISLSGTIDSSRTSFRGSIFTGTGLGNYVGSGQGIYVWGAQLERGNSVTQYEPTLR